MLPLQLMVTLALAVLGLAFGSMVNALVWRLHEKRNWVSERSECVHCHHVLGAGDLIPVFSFLFLRGKCRYCHKHISIQYPIVETVVALLFVLSYILWPEAISGAEIAVFALWLLVATGLVALAVYDLRWMQLPTRLIFSLLVLAIVMSLITVIRSDNPLTTALNFGFGSLVGGGIFYLLFIFSKGKWIGGGDVRLGFLLGLLAATPVKSLLLIFVASLLGALLSFILIGFKSMKRHALIPFGPFLVAALFIIQFYGEDIIHWYSRVFLNG